MHPDTSVPMDRYLEELAQRLAAIKLAEVRQMDAKFAAQDRATLQYDRSLTPGQRAYIEQRLARQASAQYLESQAQRTLECARQQIYREGACY